MDESGTICTFVGANAGKGRASFRATLYESEAMERVLLLKGGAGNGKSTLMRRLAAAAEAAGARVERVFCPSDPRSLDAVVCRERGWAVTDATPPHADEARYHCAPEEYLSLSPFVDGGVRERRAEIRELTAELAAVRAGADDCLRAAWEADSELTALALSEADTGLLAARGAGLAAALLPAGGPGAGPVRKRFLEGICPGGRKAFPGTLRALCGEGMRTVVLRDRLLLSPFALGAAAEEAARRGFSVWEFFDPLVPARLTGLAVPEAGVCFAPERLTGPGEAVLDTDMALSPSAREALDARADVLDAVVRALTDEAVSRLDACLAVHDRLEAVYRPYTDFAALDALSGELIGALTGL